MTSSDPSISAPSLVAAKVRDGYAIIVTISEPGKSSDIDRASLATTTDGHILFMRNRKGGVDALLVEATEARLATNAPVITGKPAAVGASLDRGHTITVGEPAVPQGPVVLSIDDVVDLVRNLEDVGNVRVLDASEFGDAVGVANAASIQVFDRGAFRELTNDDRATFLMLYMERADPSLVADFESTRASVGKSSGGVRLLAHALGDPVVGKKATAALDKAWKSYQPEGRASVNIGDLTEMEVNRDRIETLYSQLRSSGLGSLVKLRETELGQVMEPNSAKPIDLRSSESGFRGSGLRIVLEQSLGRQLN